MAMLGNTHVMELGLELEPDQIYLVDPIELTANQSFSKWSVFAGGDASSGVALLRGVVYDGSGNLRFVGDEVAIPGDQPAGWVDLGSIANVGAALLVGTYQFGVWVGGSTSVLAAGVSTGAGDVDVDAAYSSTGDPPAAISEVSAANLSLYVLTFDPWTAPNADDMELGRLAWELSQRALFGATVLPRSAQPTVAAAAVGWHGINFDQETGAFAIARTGGSCEALVGERILVVYRAGIYTKQAALYCYAQKPFPTETSDEDLSITRRAYMNLNNWAQDTITADLVVLPD